MKNIAINATLMTPQAGGIGEYMKQLISGIEKLPYEQQPFIFINQKIKSEYKFKRAANLVSLSLPASPGLRLAVENILWRYLVYRYNLGIFHSPISYIAPGVTIPSIVTIHDLRYFHYPETYTRLRGKYLQKAIPSSLQKARKIIAISEYTKKDIICTFNTDPDKITVIHQGIAKERFNIKIPHLIKEQLKKEYKLPENFILSVGHLEPRKNHKCLLQAMRIFMDTNSYPINLVVTGKENWYFKEIYDRVDELDLKKYVHFTGFVKDSDLPCFYQMAQLVISPSLFEGFGFTPLEAMAAGTPVIVSNCTSHPEICGEAAEYFNPHDPQELSEKIEGLLSDSTKRKTLMQKGYENINRFSWDTCCRRTLNVYQDLLSTL